MLGEDCKLKEQSTFTGQNTLGFDWKTQKISGWEDVVSEGKVEVTLGKQMGLDHTELRQEVISSVEERRQKVLGRHA